MQPSAPVLLSNLLTDLRDVLDDDQQRLVSRAGSTIWPDATLSQAYAFNLAKSLVKKWCPDDEPTPEQEAEALASFHEGNEACRQWELVLGTDRDAEMMGDLQRILYDFWYIGQGKERPLVDTFDQLYMKGNLGPGSNRGCRGTDLYTKLFDSPLSATSDTLAYLWAKLAGRDPRWAAAEKLRRKRYGHRLVRGNKISFVSKNVDTARSISTEPTINMWFQLGLGRILEDRLKQRFGISIRKDWGVEGEEAAQQGINRELARLGSETGRFATLDLKNASNSLSLTMVRKILPRSFMQWLDVLRSPTIELPSGQTCDLHMVATMGNGFCFPLQTIIFTAVVLTAYHHLGIRPQGVGAASDRNYAVFGDDIIVVTEAVPLVRRLLNMLGLVVNEDKSFVEGPFRESCGGDYWYGLPIRGVYIKRLRSDQDAWVAINALNRWSAMSGIKLPVLVGYLSSLCRRMYYVPLHENDDAGVHVPLAMAGARMVHAGSYAYDCTRVIPTTLTIAEDGTVILSREAVDAGEGWRENNPEGQILAFLAGNIRLGTITVRTRTVKYRKQSTVSPCWDRVGVDAARRFVSGPQLHAAVRSNLSWIT